MRSGRRVEAALILLAAVLTGLPGTALGWGSEAHRIVAAVAQQQFSPAARAEVDRLLALEPGSSLESISTWADEVRSPTTAAWHYVNFRREDGCRYDAMANCPGGNCVVGAIERQLRVLAGKGADEDRLRALRYVAHFIPDLHQPLHAGYFDDRGGNQYQVQAWGRGTNLHAVWDAALVAQWPGGIPKLKAAVQARAVESGKTDPTAWAEASCQIVATDGFYPDGHKLDPGYLQRWGPVLERQLALAAARLADAINRSVQKE